MVFQMFSPPVSGGMKGPGQGSMDMYSAYKQGKLPTRFCIFIFKYSQKMS